MTGTIQVFEGSDGVLLFGPEHALAVVDTESGLDTRRLTRQAWASFGKGAGAVSEFQEQSGRWVKLTKESTDYVRKHRATVSTGVIRGKDVAGGKGGQIMKHLKFEQVALLTPAGTASLAAMATQTAIDAALDEIKEYLEEIDAKLDRLLQQRKIEVSGQLGGISLAADEAHRIYAETGCVSSVTWSKVQANSTTLNTLLVESVEQLADLSRRVQLAAKDVDKSAKILKAAPDDVTYWLGILARTLKLQDQQYVIELARVAEAHPDQLGQHRQGIILARGDRAERITRSLEAINRSVRKSATLNNFERTANPFSAKAVVEGANDVQHNVNAFAQYAQLILNDGDELEAKTWRSAVSGLAKEAGSEVANRGRGVLDGAQQFRLGIQKRREDSLLDKAKRIRERREITSEESSTEQDG